LQQKIIKFLTLLQSGPEAYMTDTSGETVAFGIDFTGTNLRIVYLLVEGLV